MAVRLKSITFDCADPWRLAAFWSALTGFLEDPDNGNAPDDPEALLLSADGSLALLFVAVPESKQGKNRVHLDLVPLERRRDQEVDRAGVLGAQVVSDQRRPGGGGWVVLADPEGNEFCIERSDGERGPSLEQVGRAFAAVGDLIGSVQPGQWSAPTPCTDWTVRRLVDHLIGMNRVFVALLLGEPVPVRPPADHVEADPVGAYRHSAATLQAVFGQPGVLDRTYPGPLGTVTGAERLQIRLYDLLVHGWDLAQATGQAVELPVDLVEQSLAFVRTQLAEQDRPGRFGPVQVVAEHAAAIERLVAFLGRPIDAGAAARRSTSARLRCGTVLAVGEDGCQIIRGSELSDVRYATAFPSPRVQRVSPGDLVAVASAPDGTAVVVFRWYDAVVLGAQGGLIRLWEPAHGAVVAQPRNAGQDFRPGTRAYLSAGLPGADWWVAGAVAADAQDADVELGEVERFCAEHGLWQLG